MNQTQKLYNLLSDGEPHRTDEILAKVYGSEHLGAARIGARIADLKKQGYLITPAKQDPKIKSLYWYQLLQTNINGQIINDNRPIETIQSLGQLL